MPPRRESNRKPVKRPTRLTRRADHAFAGLTPLIGRAVVLDTAGPLTYLGILKEITPDGFWLETADIRDRSEGHVTKEKYVWEARENGIRPNRRMIFVVAAVVVSVSALDDVLLD